MEQYSYELKIPKDRIAVLIGPKGSVKSQIEENTKTSLDIDSKEGDVVIVGEDSILLYTAREIIKAIGRGFNPDIATLLLKQDYSLEVLNIPDYVKSKSSILRLKGRVIGKEGKSRKNIEHLTETYICVYGKTICIIGQVENVSITRRAVESILLGSPHAHVYKWLERKRREIQQAEFEMKNHGSEDVI